MTANNNNEHSSQDPLRFQWVCRLEADTNLRCLFRGLPRGFYMATWHFSYMIRSDYDGTHLAANLYNCTFGQAVDKDMFASRTTNPLQPFISTTLNFIEPKRVAQLNIPQFQPLKSDIPNIIIHQTFMNLKVDVQTNAPLLIDWDGPVACLIKKVASAPIEGYLCFMSVEMIRVDLENIEWATESKVPMEVR